MTPRPPRRGIKDHFLPFLIIVALAVVAALAVRVWSFDDGSSTSSPLARSGSVELTSIAGGIEVFLPAVGAWKITSDPVQLNSGEKVRSGAESSAELIFDDGSALMLVENSEIEVLNLQNSLSKKSVELNLARGAIGVAVGAGSDFAIAADFLKIDDPVGEFIFTADENENVASALSGEFTAVVLDPQNSKTPELQNFIVAAGEMIEVSDRRINLLRIGGEIDLVKNTSDEVKKSPIFRMMTGGEFTENPDSENPDSENSAESELEIPSSKLETNLTAPFIVTGGGNISAVAEPVKVAGRVAPEIARVEITFENGDPFVLSQFESGSGEWNYNASIEWGNLKIGMSNYSVVGFDADGNATPTANFQINFDPEGVDDSAFESGETSEASDSEIQSTDGVPVVGGETFAAPTVIEPTDGATFDSAPVHFAGTVPAGTSEVLVNEYALTSFTPSDLNWKYNAAPEWENLEVGENEFEIVAVSDSGDRSSITIKIIYSPEE